MRRSRDGMQARTAGAVLDPQRVVVTDVRDGSTAQGAVPNTENAIDDAVGARAAP
ncbi:hypothetical protein R4P64_30185 [Rhodococcus sp. IEGM 1366]|uniref:hypothetical protein n=1 Tax=Rhodococcus sp. IEGM 1366 TaxID=3082223 RepID=UPI00295575C3|nr:hypothetical protein [Rhodococcus sp. IEGM 1366]MDV8070798.1 hypothetical protein [Rhodococcus sp. IEGM 1366]